jgi:hypothetical protein
MNESPASPQLRKIRFVSRILQWGCAVAMVLPPITMLWAIAMHHYEGTIWTYNGVRTDGPQQPPLLMDASLLVGFLPQIALIWGLNQLRLLFRGFACGQIFCGNHGTHLLKFGKAVMIYVVAGSLAHLATSTLDSIGQEHLETSFYVSTDDAEWLLIGLFFCVLGWIFREGARLTEENAQIV